MIHFHYFVSINTVKKNIPLANVRGLFDPSRNGEWRPPSTKLRPNKPSLRGRRCNMSSMPSTPKWNGKATPAVSPFSGAVSSSVLGMPPPLFLPSFGGGSVQHASMLASALDRRRAGRASVTSLVSVWRHNLQPTYLTRGLHFTRH